MRHPWAAALAAVCCLVAAPRAQPASDGDLVLLDVVVTDSRGRFVPDLERGDFIVRENGRTVDVKTFTAANDDTGSHRSVVLLLDDMAVPRSGTGVVQAIASAIVARLEPLDDIAVVRLSHPEDDAFGDRILARDRIDAYRGLSEPYMDPGAPRDMLRRLVAITEQVDSLETQRKIAICVGAPIICNTTEPSRSTRDHWALWTAAIAGAARTNLSLYALIPGRVRFRSGGLPEYTGGRLFAGASDFNLALTQILQDASQYYVLGYWPEGPARDLRRIEVKTARKGLKVVARKRRGA